MGSTRRSTLGAVLVVCLLGTLTAADCNLNDVEDSEDLAAAESLDCNGDDIPDECEAPPLWTMLEEDFASGGELVRDLFLEDFSGDGLDDLGIGTAKGVFVWISSPDGLDERARQVFSPLEETARNWTAGHLDTDGDLDLVTVLPGALVQVLLNQGDATFSATMQVAFTAGIFALLADDINGDGIADLTVTQREAGTVEVALSQGVGVFSTPVTYAVGDAPGPVALDDLDADGDLDLVVVNRSSKDVSVLLQNGDGTFGEAHNLALPAGTPERLALSDVDGDSLSDVVVVQTRAIVVLSNQGEGRFGEPQPFPLGRFRSPGVVESGDLDADGDLDLTIASPREVGLQVLWNTGAGAFRAPTTVNALDTPIVAMKLRDLDADGDLDWMLGSGQVPGVRFLLNLEGERGQSFTFSAPVDYRTHGEPHGFNIGDLDLDGDIDVVTGNNEQFSNVSILLNRGDGTLEAGVRYDDGGEIFSVAPADIDGDGDIDVAGADSINPRILLLWNNGDTIYDSVTSIPVPASAWQVMTADLDGVGGGDVVVVFRSTGDVMILRNFEGDHFTEEERVVVGNAPTAAKPVDLNGDGKLDIAVSPSGTAEAVVLINNGSGGFAELRRFPLPETPNFVTAADCDGDGHPDLALSSGVSRRAMVLWNQGDATFSETTVFETGFSPFSIAAGDLDGDGLPELATAHPEFSSIRVFLNARNREFGAPYPLTTGMGRGTRFARLADLDGSGALDVLTANHDNRTITVFTNERVEAEGPEYLERLCSVRDFYSVSVPSPMPSPKAASGTTRFERSTKYLVPARDAADLVPPLFQNVDRFALTADVLRHAFPERYAELTSEGYDQLVSRRATREHYAGTLTRLSGVDGFLFAFSVVADTLGDPLEVLAEEEIRQVYQQLLNVVSLEPLVYRPETELARREAATWVDPPFPVLLEDLPPPDVPPLDDEPTFALEIPPDTTVCGVFSKLRVGREPGVEYELKSTGRFKTGTLELPTSNENLSVDLFEEVRFGPEQQLAEPLETGIFRVVRVPGNAGETNFRFNYEQSFTLPGGELFELRLFNLNFSRQDPRLQGDGRVAATRVLDERFLHFELALEGSLAGQPLVRYASCDYDLLPHWEIAVELEDGSRLQLEERFEPVASLLDTGPAALVGAAIQIEGQRQVVTDYWRLVYAARRHNRHVRYWVLLEPALRLEGLERPVGAVEITAPEPEDAVPPAVTYLDQDFQVLQAPLVRSFDKRRLAGDVPFRRGDTDADGAVNLTDALVIANFLFANGPSPACTKSADVDDSGSLNLVDAVRLVAYLFRGGPSPTAPVEDCGPDPSEDRLTCQSFPACP